MVEIRNKKTNRFSMFQHKKKHLVFPFKKMYFNALKERKLHPRVFNSHKKLSHGAESFFKRFFFCVK